MIKRNILMSFDLPYLPKKKDKSAKAIGKKIKYLVSSKKADGGRLLIIAFYQRESVANGFPLPTAVVYLTKTEYTTRTTIAGQEKWSRKRISDILGFSLYEDAAVACAKKQDETRIHSFLGETDIVLPSHYNKNIGTYLSCRQCDMNMAQRKARAKKLADEVDKRMKVVPKLPEAFNKWLDKKPLLEFNYLLYYRNKKKVDAFCTCCRNEFSLEIIPQNGDPGVCPSCGMQVHYKSAGRLRNRTEKVFASILQECKTDVGAKKDFVLRYFMIERTYKAVPGERWCAIETDLLEKARLFINDEGDITGQFKNGFNSRVDRIGWYPTKDNIVGENIKWEKRFMYAYLWNYWFEPSYLYPHNIKKMLGKFDISYSLMDKICGKAVNVTTPLLQTIKYPFVESLAAAGYKTLYNEIKNEGKRPAKSERKGKLYECLCVPKSFMPVVQKFKFDVHDLNLAASVGAELTDEDYLWLATNKLPVDVLYHFKEYATITNIRRYVMQQAIAISKSKEHAKMGTCEKQLLFWQDYVNMAIGLNFNMDDKEVLFPDDLKRAHDVVSALTKVSFDPVMDKKIKAVYGELYEQYFYENETLLMRPPHDFKEFSYEGAYLKHCVASNKYYIKHVNGSSRIFFIREKEFPEKPYYTLEYDPKRESIIQCYGYDHRWPTVEVSAFYRSWLNEITGRENIIKAA